MKTSNAPEGATASLPESWRDLGKSGLLSAVALARVVMVQLVDGFLEGPRSAKLAAELVLLRSELAFVRRELGLLESRFGRVEPRKRPHFEPAERLEVLALRAARGWTIAETARRFLVTPATIASWFRRRDGGGDDALLRTRAPVNKFPDLVHEVVGTLKATFPFLGTRRIAEILARLGLRLADTTVRRMLKARPAPPRKSPSTDGSSATSTPREAGSDSPTRDEKRVVARCTHHVWHTDFTFVPTWMGIWVPWAWFALPQFWPFGWWVGAVIDQHTRAVLNITHWKNQPTAKQTVAMLSRATTAAGTSPRHLITDRGPQFQRVYRAWCDKRDVRPRFGAVHRHGSIAIIERFWGSLKRECLRRFLVPTSTALFGRELRAYLEWYNLHRPHRGLAGRTPHEVRFDRKAGVDKRGIEARPRMPLARAGPRRVGHLALVVDQRLGSAELPVVHLKHAA